MFSHCETKFQYIFDNETITCAEIPYSVYYDSVGQQNKQIWYWGGGGGNKTK